MAEEADPYAGDHILLAQIWQAVPVLVVLAAMEDLRPVRNTSGTYFP